MFAMIFWLFYLAFWAVNGGFALFVSFHAALIMFGLLVIGHWRDSLVVLGIAVAILFLYFLIAEPATSFFILLFFLNACCVLFLFAGFLIGLVSNSWGLFKGMLRALAALFLLHSFFEDRVGFYLILLIWCAVEFFPSLVVLSKKAWAKTKLRKRWRKR